MWEQLEIYDQWLLQEINNSFLSQFPQFWIFVTNIAHWTPVYLFIIALFIKVFRLKKGLITVLFLIITTATSIGITDLVKHATARLRPNNNPELIDHIHILQTPLNYSFWSGHSAVSMAIAMFVILVLHHYRNTHLWKLFLIWPLLFGASRLFIGVHYPVDVIIGYGAGAIIAYGCYRIYMITITSLGLK